MIRGFLGLLLIVGAVAALARDTSAAPAATDAKQRPGFQTARPASSTASPASPTARPASVRVRFIISDIKPESCKFEQSFSTDGGKTWEANWIAIDTRVKE